MSISFNTIKTFFKDDNIWKNTLLVGSSKSRCKDFISLIDKCLSDNNYQLSEEESLKYSNLLEQEASYMNLNLIRGSFSRKEHKLLEYYSLLLFNIAELLEITGAIRQTLLLNQLLLEKDLTYSEVKTLVNFYLQKHFYGNRSKTSSFFSTKYIEENIESKKGV